MNIWKIVSAAIALVLSTGAHATDYEVLGGTFFMNGGVTASPIAINADGTSAPVPGFPNVGTMSDGYFSSNFSCSDYGASEGQVAGCQTAGGSGPDITASRTGLATFSLFGAPVFSYFAATGFDVPAASHTVPSIDLEAGTADMSSFYAIWSGVQMHQGSLDPVNPHKISMGGVFDIYSTNGIVTDNLDGTYTISWSSMIVGAPFDGFVGSWTMIVRPLINNVPTLVLNGDELISVNVGETYIDSGATASDVEDGNLSDSIIVTNPVDTSIAGTYTVSYSVTDSAANTISVSRKVIVDYLDLDRDGVLLSNDNCAVVANPDQRDTDGDGIGNYCDADLNNDNIVNALDLGLFRQRYFSTDEDADFNGDGIVNALDLGMFRQMYFKPPGPSGVLDSADYDEDGTPDIIDLDDDNDGVEDTEDAFPFDAVESVDTDGDGTGNNADLDDDNDGVEDSVDAFPLDAAESVDTDGDGTGDNTDAYVNDAACYLLDDGDGTACYATLIGSVGVSEIIVDQNNISYLHVSSWPKIFRFNNVTQQYLQAIDIGQTSTLNKMAYSASHSRLYLGYVDGAITYIDLNAELVEHSFASLPLSVNGLVSVGQYMLAQDSSGAWNTHYVFDVNGVMTSNADWNRYSPVYAWNEVNNRVYFFRNGTSPNDLHYEEINQTTGTITSSGETPYHGDYLITPPIRISQDGTKVLLGSGDIYDATNLNWLGSIGTSFDDAVWMANGDLVTVKSVADQTRLERRDISTNTIVEQIYFNGTPQGIFKAGSAYTLVIQDSLELFFIDYQPSDDSDDDGVDNLVDAFPLDPAASVDSDGDGYPDSWNDGYTEAQSNTGLILDSYSQDSACYLLSHGDGVQCDYSSTMPVFTPDKVVKDVDGMVYLLSSENNRIFRWSAETASYTNPVYVGSSNVLSASSPSQMVYSSAHQRLYLGYASGVITYIDLNTDMVEHPFANLPLSVRGLVSVGQYMLAQDSSGAWDTHYIFDVNGVLTDSQEWNYYSRVYAWNEANNRVYFFRNSQSPNDLHYEEINQTTGAITSSGETPYHGSYSITPPIRISQDGAQVLLGSGDIYDATTLNWLNSLGSSITDAVWFENALMTVSGNVTDSSIQMWNTDGTQLTSEYHVEGSTISLLPYGIDAIRVYTDVNGLQLVVEQVGDHDGDGLPAWWENVYGLSDADALDADLNNDADGLSNLEEFNLNTEPDNADTDGDGLSDGDEVNTHLTDPLTPDSDSDGINDGDEINVHATNPLLQDTDADGLSDYAEINQYGTSPLSSDTDNDGIADGYELANSLDPLINDASVDVDFDGLTNLAEFSNGTDPNNSDTDNDGLIDGMEVIVNATDPLVSDTDGDRISDGWEILNGLDPLNTLDGEQDADSDGYNNMMEFALNSDPNDALSVPEIPAWTTYQGGADHTGFVPVVLDPANFTERWNIAPLSGRNLNPVTAADGKVFVSESTYYSVDQTVAAINAVDGSVIWQNGYGNINSIDPPAYADGKVYFQTGGHGDSFLRGLDADTGALVFSSSYSNQWSKYYAPTPYAENIYINGGYYGGAYGFNGSDGSLQWFANLSQYDSWTPAVDQDHIYAYTGGGGSLSVLNRLTGELEFSISDPSYSWTGYSMNLAPVLGNNQNVLAINGGRLINFDLQNQTIGWQRNANFSGQPSLAFGQIYAISNGALSVMDETSGNEVWNWAPPGFGTVSGNMIATMNLVFLHDSTTTYAVDLNTHQSVWSYPAAGHLSMSNEGALYIATSSGSLIAINISGDEDHDGMPGWWENVYGLSDADALDADLDNDADGLSNLEEFNLNTEPDNADTDGDGLSDGDEVNIYLTDPLNPDSDSDGINDGDEINVHATSPLSQDTDADGLSDFAEINQHGTSPLNSDTDNDGIADGYEVANSLDPLINDALVDLDFDGLTNLAEFSNGTDPNNSDTDNDGLIDGMEVIVNGTDPLVSDTDGDRISDGWEILNGLDPLNALDGEQDADNDGYNNMTEYVLKTDPHDALSVPVVPAWTTYQGGADHTGFVPVTLDPANFTERWNIAPLSGRNLHPVTAADGKVFVSESTYYGVDQTVAAINAVDGSVIWQNGYGNISSINPPAYADGKVYFQTGGHGDSFLRGLDADTGTLVFRSSYSNQWSRHKAPTPYADKVYINGGYYGGAYGFDSSDGSQQWFANLSQYDNWTPAVDQDRVYVYAGSMSVLNRLTGELEFSISDPSLLSSSGLTPVLGNNQNVFVISGSRLISFDLQNETIGWQRNANFSGQPSLALEQIYAISSGALSVMDEHTGNQQWAWEPPGGGSISGNIIVTMNLVFLHDGSTTYAVDLNTHQSVWSYPAAGHLSMSNEGALYIATTDGSLIAINISGDEDHDGMPGWWETAYGLDDSNSADAGLDTDGDVLTNLQEYENNTSPLNTDTDGDGVSDGDEVNVYFTNPYRIDSDNDGLSDGFEIFTFLTDPLIQDSDLDGFNDGDEVNVYGTDPVDATSVPAVLSNYSESFEAAAIPAGWVATTLSNANWFIDNTIASDATQSIRSGVIANSQQSRIEYSSLFAAGILSYSARVESEACCDRLYFYVDSILVHTITSSSSWATFQTNLTNGEHILEWRYVKDGSVSSGADAAWIDNVIFSN